MNTSEQLIELIKANPRYTPTGQHYVSIYRKEQTYGGSEEGGWWHTVNTLEGSVAFPSLEQAELYVEHAEQLVEKLQQQANKERRDAFVLNHRDGIDYEDDFCTGESLDETYFVHIEEKQGELDNTNEPIGHWE